MSDEESTEEQVSPLPEGVMEELKSKHGGIVAFTVPGLGPFAFHKANQATSDRLTNKVSGKESEEKSQHVREYVLSCLCFPRDSSGKPAWDAARALFEAAPDLPSDLLHEIKDLAPKIDIKKW